MNLSKSVVPGTYTLAEKLESLKLNAHQKVNICMADKLAVRKYISQKTKDPKLLNHLYGVYDNPDEFNLDGLPSEFVVKPTTGLAIISSAGTSMSSILK